MDTMYVEQHSKKPGSIPVKDGVKQPHLHKMWSQAREMVDLYLTGLQHLIDTATDDDMLFFVTKAASMFYVLL